MQSTTLSTDAPQRPLRGTLTFALHFGEMLIAMFVGMAVLGGLLVGAAALAGMSTSGTPAALDAAIMAVTMTVPMVAWMHYRGHPLQMSVEMGASMIVPTAAVIVLFWLGAIAGSSLMAIQHVVMIPAMLAVMLFRHGHYSH